jgi:hypothetical protein
VLGRLIEAVRSGESQVLVIRGEPGVGKTALVDYLAEQASGCRVMRTLGVQSEMELAFAGLHQLCAPMLNRLDRLPLVAGADRSGAGRSRRAGVAGLSPGRPGGYAGPGADRGRNAG